MAETLIIGLGINGPSHQVVQTTRIDKLIETFSWTEERHSVTATASSLMLDYTPFSSVSFNIVGTGPYLYQPYTSNSSAFFGPIGATPSNPDIDARYRTYLGKADLVTAAENFLITSGKVPKLCRIKGEQATCVIGGWEFAAQYTGSKYNSMSITSTASTITFSGLYPRYSARTFSTTGDMDQLVTDIQIHNHLGIIPFYVKTNSGTIPSSGAVAFSGGTDGEITSSTLREALEMCVTTDVTQVLILAEATSSLISTVLDYVELYDLQPRMFFFQAPSATGTISSYITELQTLLPERSKWISLVLGESNVDLNTASHSRWNVENAVCAYQGSYLTNKPMRVLTLSPALTEAELEALYESGVMTVVRKIGSGISIYKGCVSSADLKYPYAHGIALASSVAYSVLNTYFGKFLGVGRNAEIETRLMKELTNSGVDVIECVAEIFEEVAGVNNTRNGIVIEKSGKHLNCQLTIRIFDEILSFNFEVKN